MDSHFLNMKYIQAFLLKICLPSSVILPVNILLAFNKGFLSFANNKFNKYTISGASL